MIFTQKYHHSISKNIISEISAKNGVDLWSFKTVSENFFFSNFSPYSPRGIDPKKWKRSKRVFYRYFIISPVTFLMSNCILQGWNLTLAVQMPFLIIFIFSGLFLGGSRAKNSKKKKFSETVLKDHKSTQFFALISDMIFFWYRVMIVLSENHQILAKKPQKTLKNHVIDLLILKN